MEDFDINSIIKDINFEEDFIGYINGDIVLSNKEMEVLKRNEIKYEEYDTVSRLLTDIDEILLDNDDEDLEEVSQSISERNYYLNTNK
jgi:hypothetical protein